MASAPTWYAINKAAGSDAAEVTIYDEIGAWGITAKQFVADLKKIDAKTINLRLNTPGGEVFDGTAIYNALKEHPANVIVHIDGVAASAGSFIAMSGDEIRMADNAYLMIHNAHGGVVGDAKAMRAYADSLEKINGNIANMYAKKSGKKSDHYRTLMDAETWFTAVEAKDDGLVDTVTDGGKPVAMSPRSSFDFTIYNKIPAPVRKLWGMDRQPTELEPGVFVGTVERLLSNKLQPNEAPMDTQRSDPAATNPKEITAMPNDSTTVTAPAPAPVTAPDTSVSATYETKLADLKTITATGYVEQGKKLGAEAAITQERDRLTKIVATCPGKPQMALDAFLNGQTAESVKLAFDAEARAEARAREESAQRELHIQRLEALIATGGTTGVAMTLAVTDADAPRMAPKAQAEWEWENRAEVRRTASTKDVYVLARTAELDGTHRSFARQSA